MEDFMDLSWMLSANGEILTDATTTAAKARALEVSAVVGLVRIEPITSGLQSRQLH